MFAESTPLHEPRRTWPGGGATLTFAPEDDVRGNVRPPARQRILIVEDDFFVVSQMEAALRDAGFDIAGVAASGEEAVALAAAEAPVLCVMDVRLAGERDGIDAAIDLFRQHGIRCIFATAYADREVRRRAQAADPLGWLQKPYRMDALVASVRDALAGLRDDEE